MKLTGKFNLLPASQDINALHVPISVKICVSNVIKG